MCAGDAKEAGVYVLCEGEVDKFEGEFAAREEEKEEEGEKEEEEQEGKDEDDCDADLSNKGKNARDLNPTGGGSDNNEVEPPLAPPVP